MLKNNQINLVQFVTGCLILILLVACTDDESPVWVTELQVFPKSYSIQSEKFLSKPFTVRAIYSDGKKKNVTSEVSWLSENGAILSVNASGELALAGPCKKSTCVVSLVATHEASGQSQRIEVKVHAPKEQIKESQTPGVGDKTKPSSEVERATDQIEPESYQPESSSAENQTAKGDSSRQDLTNLSNINDTEDDQSQEPQTSKEQSGEAPRIGFSRSEIRIQSGERYTPRVVLSTDESLTQSTVLENAFSCQLDFNSESTVTLTELCTAIAGEPGRATLHLSSSEYAVGNTASLIITVVPQKMHYTELNKVAQSMLPEQQQVWITLSDVPQREPLKISVDGLSGLGAQLLIMPEMNSNRGACLNYTPAGFAQAACIVKTEFDSLNVIIYKPDLIANSLRFTIKDFQHDVFAFTELSQSENPRELILDAPVTAYILANEFEVYSRHYYQFTPSSKPISQRGFQVILNNYQQPPSLEVYWENGFCANNKIQQNNTEQVCQLPADVSGRVKIVVNANKSPTMAHSLVATQGGTPYTLKIKQN